MWCCYWGESKNTTDEYDSSLLATKHPPDGNNVNSLHPTKNADSYYNIGTTTTELYNNIWCVHKREVMIPMEILVPERYFTT